MYRHELVRALVAHYAEAASVNKQIRVFSRPSVFEKHMERRGEGLTRSELAHLRQGHAMTVLDGRRPPIFFNLAKHQHVADLADSAAHEITHIRWPSLEHGALFDKRVKALLGGYRCGPAGKRLPEAFR